MNYKTSIILSVIILSIAGLAHYMGKSDQDLYDGKAQEEVTIKASFSLTNEYGKSVTEADFAGKKMLVYFGFTNCPDMCPTDMLAITSVLQALGEKANQVQPIFITVDPVRDTPKQIKLFLANFYPTFTGLTGTEEQIQQAASAFKVYFQKQQSDQVNGYNMDHSGYTYLMDEEGRFITHFSHGQDQKQMIEILEKSL